MTKLLVHHGVGDYAAWRRGFDAHKSSQTGAGLSNGRVYRGADESNDIVILFDVAEKAKAQAWMKGEDLKTAMQKSGVVGEAAIHFVDGGGGHASRRLAQRIAPPLSPRAALSDGRHSRRHCPSGCAAR